LAGAAKFWVAELRHAAAADHNREQHRRHGLRTETRATGNVLDSAATFS